MTSTGNITYEQGGNKARAKSLGAFNRDDVSSLLERNKSLGSDSHRAIDVCADFDKSYEMLECLGFRYVSVFKNRKCEFIPIYQSAYHTA